MSPEKATFDHNVIMAKVKMNNFAGTVLVIVCKFVTPLFLADKEFTVS